MTTLTSITDEEFVPFLHNLGVDTYKKSFEWMLQDNDFSHVLQWLYNNLDHNNALTAREECRYAELEKKGNLLSPEDLESSLTSIRDQYPGICVPGDKEGLEDVKLDIRMQKERLHLLERHGSVFKELVKQNELIKDEVSAELTKLNSAQQQSTEDGTTAAEQCLAVAEEVESLTEGVIDVIADSLEMYGSCHVDKEIARRFLTFGPLESYRQTQALFKSHFDLYTSKKFCKQTDSITDDDLRAALIEAKSLEERLSEALCAYIDSKAELCGEQAKLALVTNYAVVHPSQATVLLMEAQTAVSLLSQEESILDQQIQTAVKDLVNSRTRLAVETTTKSALAVREQIHTDLAHLLETAQQAVALDRALCRALRRELRTAEQIAQFATELRAYVAGERVATASRRDAMLEIAAQQESCESKLESADPLLEIISSILGVPKTDAVQAMKLFVDLQSKVRDLKSDVLEGFRRKEDALNELKTYLEPLRAYIFDGCTKQPNCRDRTAAALTHSLRQEMERAEERVVEIGSLFTSVKNGDKQNLRKLWQWFLTDQTRLIAAVKSA